MKSAKKVKVTCKVQLVSPASSSRVRWRLMRAGKSYRSGVTRARGGRTLFRIPGLEGLPSGRYRLKVGGEHGGSTVIRVG